MELRHVWIAAICTLLASSGCNCSDQRQRPEGDGWIVGDIGPDLGDGGETGTDSGRDTTDDVLDTDIPPLDVCGPNAVEFETVHFDVPYLSPAGPAVSEGVVYSEKRARENLDASLGIVRISPQTGEVEEQLSSSESGDRLLDVARGRALAVRKGGPDGRDVPVIVESDGTQQVLDGFSDRWDPRMYRRGRGEGRPFDGERFGAVLENDPNASPGWVGYFGGAASREVHIQEWTRRPVALMQGGFVISARTGPLSGGGNYEIYAYNPNADGAGETGVYRVTETEERHERAVESTEDWIYWNDDQGVYRVAPNDWERTRIYRGNCGPVDADGPRGVFSCLADSDGERSDGFPTFGERLVYYTGSRTVRVPTGGGFVYQPRVSGRRVVWAEYESREALMQHGTGELRYWEQGWEESRVVSRIGAPCLACSALTPDVHLSIDGDLIARNYATPGMDGPPAETQFGAVTRVVRGCP